MIDPAQQHEERAEVAAAGASFTSRLIKGSALGLVAALLFTAAIYFLILKKPDDQITQSITPPVTTQGGNPAAVPPPGRVPAPENPGKTEPVKPENVTKPEPAKTEPAKTEPVKPEPVKTEPIKQVKPEPAKPVKPEPDRPAPTSTGPTGSGRFAIQVAASPKEAEAKAIGNRLQAAGFQSYVVRADLGNRGIWYRVRLSQRFQTQGEAKRQADAVRAKGFDSFVAIEN
jgi:cell division protein FtsN